MRYFCKWQLVANVSKYDASLYGTTLLCAKYLPLEIGRRVLKKNQRRFRLLHCRLTPPLQRTPANIRTNFISPETKFQWPTFLPLIVWVYLHSVFVVGSERRIFSGTECVSAVQGHPRLILAQIERAYATSY